MSLFQVKQPVREHPSKVSARTLLTRANKQLDARVQEHRDCYNVFWNGGATPAQVAAELGADGARYLAAASESVRHIATLAAIAGKKLDDVLPPIYYMPRLPLTPNEDGTVTVGTVEGLDAWGRTILAVEPGVRPFPAP